MMTSLHSTLRVFLIAGLVAVLAVVPGCDFLDPTGVDNPQTTREDLTDAENPTASLLPGLRAQFARALGATVTVTEFVTDNFSINGTGVGGDDLDFPRSRITPQVTAINSLGDGFGIYFNLQELRALGDFTLEQVAPDDDTATDQDLAEAHYYRGMAYLMQGENFVALPTAEGEEPVAAQELLQRAVSDFEQTRSLDPDGAFAVHAAAALARTYRALGNTTETGTFAQTALDEGGDEYLFQQIYDNEEDNPPHDFLVERSLQEMQPLPRLDFLDPKYVTRTSGIAVSKAEEMHLILAELDLAASQPGPARDHLIDAIALANSRPTTSFDDTDERLDNNLNRRPDTSAIEIAFEPGGTFVEGLVLNRPGVVETPTVSGTHITAADVNAASDDELTRLLYLLRQEIMLLEARRMHDLGIRLPMMLREIETNPNISPGDPGTEVAVPAYIPDGNRMDRYTPVEIYSSGELVETQIAILHDMNRVLAEQRGLVITNPLLAGN